MESECGTSSTPPEGLVEGKQRSCRFEMLREFGIGDDLMSTGVWWDLNTCPVPAGIEAGSVRGCIESALRKLFGESRPVTIFGVGNLEYVSPEVLIAISSSGIILRDTPFRGKGFYFFLFQWIMVNPPPGDILLISGDSTWFSTFIYGYGYNVLRAFPQVPCWPTFVTDEADLIWTSLLEENTGGVEPTMVRVFEPAWYCQRCHIPIPSCQDFINHLKSEEHRQKLFFSVPLDDNHKPVLLCQVCQYPGYDDHNMKIHFNSDEHKSRTSQNVISFGKAVRAMAHVVLLVTVLFKLTK